MKQNKLSLFAIPYVVWMAIFVVIAHSSWWWSMPSPTAGRRLHPGQLRPHLGTYAVVFTRSFKLALIATVICLLIGYPIAYFLAREGSRLPADGHDAHHAAHVDEFPAAHLRLDVHSGEHRPAQPAFLTLSACSTSSTASLAPTSSYFHMINTQGAVVLGMVYNYLPFMILPIYSVIVKLDHSPASRPPGTWGPTRPRCSAG